jgi:hypothetical protein
MYARDEFIKQIRNGLFPVSDPQLMVDALREFGAEVYARSQTLFPNYPRIPRGILAATLDKNPRVYFVNISFPPLAGFVAGQATFGDEKNPALLFPNYYYERCGKSVGELVSIGVHTMRMAATMNSRGIGGLSVWIYQDKDFRQLLAVELEPYIAFSESLDESISEQFRCAPVPP